MSRFIHQESALSVRHRKQPQRWRMLAFVAISGLCGFLPLAWAGPKADVNCNSDHGNIPSLLRALEGDCVDYVLNGNSCTEHAEVTPHRPCDDYVAFGVGQVAQCSQFLAPDRDRDEVGDSCDNCPNVYNPDQTDTDKDGIGDACDNCQNVPNSDQADSDHDGTGDACNACVTHIPNPNQKDTDHDGLPDVCDNCPNNVNVDQKDTDRDGVGDACDKCLNKPNPDQRDSDGDGIPDACDNCPAAGQSNPDQADHDSDGVGDACDNCPAVYNPDQADSDRNGLGDLCEPGVKGGPQCALVQNRGGSLPESLANIFAGLSVIAAALYFSTRRRRLV